MNISDLVTQYVAFRRTLGERCKGNEDVLRSFCRAVGPHTRMARIHEKHITEFLTSSGRVTNAWHVRFSALKGFFEFALSHGHVRSSPLPAQQPKRLPTLVPYIYSRSEIRSLLNAIRSVRLPRRMEPPTLRAMLLLMYGAGLRRGEVLNLSSADADLENSLLTIRDTKFFKSRWVPIGRDLTNVLNEYVRWRSDRFPATDTDSHFFLDRKGAPLTWWPLHHAFDRLRRHADVKRSDGGRYQPRMHDLRHTFAVHCLTDWYRRGLDVQRLVYHLSVYLGHSQPADTQVYLTMTPELLQQAGARFERYTHKEEDHA
jgi:integrase/recombinase XerD